MHLVILSDTETEGGASIAASRLSEALYLEHIRVTRIVGSTDGLEHPWATQSLIIDRWKKRALKALNFASEALSSYILRRLVSSNLDRLLAKLGPDVINVHNLHGAGWPLDLLRVCSSHAKTLWTLHDMWSFTGRCAYSYNCIKFVTGCDASCPTLTEYPTLSAHLISDAWSRREGLFNKHQELVAVSPSCWLAQEAAKGFWKNHRVEVIPNGLPLDVYKPIDKNLARAALNIDAHEQALLMAAQNLSVRRKGGDILVKALQKVSHRPIALITFGHGSLPVKMDDVQVYQLGYVNPERVKVLVYNASDLLVHPAPVDNLPNTVMEAIACGTPVVAFPVGGVPEMVRSGQTGWLADEVSPEALAETIDTAIEDLRNGVIFRGSCRAVANSEYGSELQARRYLKLFESL